MLRKLIYYYYIIAVNKSSERSILLKKYGVPHEFSRIGALGPGQLAEDYKHDKKSKI